MAFSTLNSGEVEVFLSQQSIASLLQKKKNKTTKKKERKRGDVTWSKANANSISLHWKNRLTSKNLGCFLGISKTVDSFRGWDMSLLLPIRFHSEIFLFFFLLDNGNFEKASNPSACPTEM
jgi:hypothetical protein